MHVAVADVVSVLFVQSFAHKPVGMCSYDQRYHTCPHMSMVSRACACAVRVCVCVSPALREHVLRPPDTVWDTLGIQKSSYTCILVGISSRGRLPVSFVLVVCMRVVYALCMIHASMCVRMHACMCAYIHGYLRMLLYINMYVCAYVGVGMYNSMYVRIYVCAHAFAAYIYIYIYICDACKLKQACGCYFRRCRRALLESSFIPQKSPVDGRKWLAFV